MYQIIVNPNCGSGHGNRKWLNLKELLDLAKMTYIVYKTKSAKDVTRYTRKTTDKSLYENKATANHLLLLGGDGTLNHCINGIDDLEHTTITYLPSGSANDFSRALGITQDPLKAVYALGKNGKTKRIDLGNVLYDTKKVRFAVSAGIGYDAAVCRGVLHSPLKPYFNKIGLGRLIYGAIALKQFITLRPCGCDLWLDDDDPIHFDTFLLAAFMNLKYEGGGFPFAPDADPDDGLLDICLVGNLPKIMVPFVLPFVFMGKHYGKPGVHHYRAKKIRITTEKPLFTHTDGEVIGKHNELTITCGEEKLFYRKK